MPRKKIDTSWPSKGEIAYWWENYLHQEYKNGNDIYDKYPHCMDDWGEPDCWACGRYDPKFNDINEYVEKMKIPIEEYEANPNRYIFEMWCNAKLERHHIIPRSLGGSDEPSNFCLLCHDCHTEAPHTNDSDYFWQWARERKQNQVDLMFNLTKEAMALAGEAENYELVNSLFFHRSVEQSPLHKEFQRVLAENVSFHGYGHWSAFYRDEIYHCIKYIKSQGWTIEYMKQIENEVIKDYMTKLDIEL